VLVLFLIFENIWLFVILVELLGLVYDSFFFMKFGCLCLAIGH
jgi:hypothetical protein